MDGRQRPDRFLGLAAACCGDDPELAEIRDLVQAVDAAWAEIAVVELEARREETRKLFRMIGLAQAMAMYGGSMSDSTESIV